MGGGGVCVGTMAASDVDYRSTRERSVQDVGTLGGVAGIVIAPKMAARSLIAAICLVQREGKEEAGAVLLRVTMSSCTAAVAALAEDVAGILVLW